MNLSIVIPIYNSSKILHELINQLNLKVNRRIVKKFEIILVNDCSKDNSWDIIKKIKRKNSKIEKDQTIFHLKNLEENKLVSKTIIY